MNNNDRVNLIKRITEIEGLTDNERSALLGLLRENKTYGLVWENKPEDVEERLRDELPILTEVPERAIISEDKDAPNHILIEGDNLEVLTTLAYTHAGKIDVIYIDPPYNTGAKNWKYNNDYVDNQDEYRHSKWLSFMNKRLRIAKSLLSNEGIIIVTIDDYEIENLTLLMNQIYGEQNRLGTFIIKNNPSGRSTLTGVSVSHEYALFYSRKQDVKLGRLPRDEKQLARYKEKDKDGYYEWVNFRKHGGYKEDAPSMYYPIYIKRNGSSFRIPKLKWDAPSKEYIVQETPSKDEFISYPNDEEGRPRRWKWSLQRVKSDTSDVSIRKDRSGNYSVYIKSRMKDEGMLPLTVWDDKKYSSTEYGTNLLSTIVGKKQFDYPKSLFAVIDCLKVGKAHKKSVILDFFAGSGTTLHATMKLNAEDGGYRQCILVTNNESNICEEVTYVRNKKVIEGYITPKGEAVPGLSNNNLRYYRTGFVGRSRSMQNMRKLVNLATDMLCIKENLYTEQTKFGELKTYKNIFRYFDDGKKQMLVIYREDYIDELVDIIYQMEFESPLKVYVFSPSEDPWEGSFEDVLDKVELCALPQAIYNTYRRILPKKKDMLINPEEDVLDQGGETEELDGMFHFIEEGEEA